MSIAQLLVEALEESKIPPAKEFWAQIDRAPADRYMDSMEVDWGRRARGQGKRSGGMVMGGMSDAPTGKKSYPLILGKAPLAKKDADEAKLLSRRQQAMFAKALAAGYKADVAFLVAYTVDERDEPLSRDEAYKAIVRTGT